MDAEEIETPPYYETIGIELVEIEPGHAVARLAVGKPVSSAENAPIAHGGVIASLADSAGYWAISAENGLATTPTIDLRMDYLAPATDDVCAVGTVVRNGDSVGVANVETETETEGRTVATARGVSKTGGDPTTSAWDDRQEA